MPLFLLRAFQLTTLQVCDLQKLYLRRILMLLRPVLIVLRLSLDLDISNAVIHYFKA